MRPEQAWSCTWTRSSMPAAAMARRMARPVLAVRPPRAATHLLRRMALRQLRTSSRRLIRKASRPPRDSRRPIPCPEVLPGMKASAIPATPSFNRLPVGPNEYQAYKAHSSWKHIRGLCAFFAFLGGDALRNQAFQARTETGKRRKLEVVLRQLTRDHLTDQQRQLISQTVGCCQQYSFQLCRLLPAIQLPAVLWAWGASPYG